MTALLLPSRWTQQPQGAVEVDWSNPLANGLTGTLDVSSGSPRLNGLSPTTNTSNLIVTDAGVAANFDGTKQVIFANSALPGHTGELSLAALVRVDALTNYGALISHQTTTTTGGFEFRIGVGATDSRLVMHRANAGFRQTAASGSNVLSAGAAWARIVVTCEALIETPSTFYVNGVKFAGAWLAGAGTGAATAPTGTVCVGRRTDGATQLDGAIALLNTWGRALTEAEARAWSDNPWQMFRPQVRRIYFDLGAGGGVTNMTLTASASGSASFARAVQAIKSASATSAAVTERLIAIQRSASAAGTASLTSSKSVLRTVDASASGSASASRVVGIARSVSSTATATYSRAVGLLRSVTGAGTAALTGPATTQFLRPDGNVTQTSFTGGFAEIDEVTASDADFAYGTNNTAATLEVSLSNPAEAPGSGTTTVRYRVAKTNAGVLDGGGNAVTVTASVYQGTTLISADAARTVTGTWTDYSWTPDMSSVTDWNDIRLRFVTSASGGTAANRRGGAVSWAEAEVPAAGAVTFNQALNATSTAAASFVRSVGRIASASASGAASFVRSVGKSESAEASGTATFVRAVDLVRAVSSTASATLTASRALFATLAASSTGTATLAAVSAVSMTLAAAATGSALMTASVGLLIVAAAVGTASASRVIGLTRAAASNATATIHRGLTRALSAVASVAATLTKLASTAGTSLARMLSISAENRIHTPDAENRIRSLDSEDRDLTQ